MAAPCPDLEYRACPPTRVQHAPRDLRDQKHREDLLDQQETPQIHLCGGHLLAATFPDTTLPGFKRGPSEPLKHAWGHVSRIFSPSCGLLAIHPYASVVLRLEIHISPFFFPTRLGIV